MMGAADAWVEDIQRFQDEAAGVLALLVVQLADVPPLLAAGKAGSAEATSILVALEDTLTKIQGAPPDKPMLCASCPLPLRNGAYSIVIARPARDRSSGALAFAVCRHCGTTESAIRDKAQAALQRLWPELRPITVTHTHGGRA